MISLTIQCNPQTGQVQLTGPLGNRALCLRVLEMAKQAVQQQSPPEQDRITIAGPEQTRELLRCGPRLKGA